MSLNVSPLTQAEAFIQFMNQMRWIKQQAQAGVSVLAGNVSSTQVFQLMDNLRSPLTLLAAVAAVPGMATYVQAQLNQPTFDAAGWFNGVVSAINGIVSWVTSNFPKDAAGFIESQTINADGSRSDASFTPAQTAALTTALNSLIAELS